MLRLPSFLRPVDLVNLVFFFFLTLAMLAWAPVLPLWPVFVVTNLLVLAVVPLLARVVSRSHHPWKEWVHGLMVLALIPLAFKQMYFLVPAIHPVDRDPLLIAIDHALFGVHPTQWLSQFAHPVLTEILQLAYSSYYLLPLILAIDLFRRGRVEQMRAVFFIVLLGFFLSYLGYVAVPAVGPRFTLHDFSQLERELPGLLITPHLRTVTNNGEAIPEGTPHPEKVVQRDVFPSGHTQITLLVVILAFRFRSRVRWVLLIIGSLLIIATVYLRYHYVIDLIGGVVFAIGTLGLAPRIEAWLHHRTYPQS